MAFDKRFGYALKKLQVTIVQNKKRKPFEDMIIKMLLKRASWNQKDNKTILVDMINNNSYEDAINFLREKRENVGLNRFDSYTLYLLEKLIDIKVNNDIPIETVFSADNIFEAIDGDNYDLALALMDQYANENDLSNERNSIYLILAKIKEEISVLREKTHVEAEVIDNFQKGMPNNHSGYMDVLNYLMKQDLDNAFKSLKSYLDSIGKSEYEFFIIDLIKISLLNNDVAYSKPMIALTYLSNNIFEFNISEYVQNFYLTLSQNKFDEARVYLDIISKSKNVVESNVIVGVLEQALNMLEEIKNNKDNDNLENSSIELDKTILTCVDREHKNNGIDDNIKREEKQNKSTPTSSNIQSFNNDRVFIQGKLEKLYIDGLILLKPMDNKRRKSIHNIVDHIPNVVSFSIGSGDERRIVLRGKPDFQPFKVRQIIADGNHAYELGNFDVCIDNYKRLLSFDNPKPYVYAKLGLSYMKLGNTELAIDYLTVANELSKLSNNPFDYNELIDKLKGKSDNCSDVNKPYVRFFVDEFVDDMHDYYEVPNMEEIFDLVSSGKSIEEAASIYNLTDEDIKIVYLIFAKKCYAEEKYSTGDRYFKVVEKSSNKTDFIKWLLNEVRTNKKFYKNRVEVLQKQYKIN